mmetsp:Transcript_28310/g.90176  ORF Transcript_28310/g.90176 Transcript_28310/m.90176 type:complete len:233 (+) Transcript_28310:464-1162(+)
MGYGFPHHGAHLGTVVVPPHVHEQNVERPHPPRLRRQQSIGRQLRGRGANKHVFDRAPRPRLVHPEVSRDCTHGDLLPHGVALERLPEYFRLGVHRVDHREVRSGAREPLPVCEHHPRVDKEVPLLARPIRESDVEWFLLEYPADGAREEKVRVDQDHVPPPRLALVLRPHEPLIRDHARVRRVGVVPAVLLGRVLLVGLAPHPDAPVSVHLQRPPVSGPQLRKRKLAPLVG